MSPPATGRKSHLKKGWQLSLLRKLGHKCFERKQTLKQNIWASLLIIRVDIRKYKLNLLLNRF